MKSDLLGLKNLGNTSVNWLRAVGIGNYDELKRNGAVLAYNKIRRRGFRVSKVLLYALHGALVDAHWNELDADLKIRLVEEAEALIEEVDAT
jgi:DNA transformation protein